MSNYFRNKSYIPEKTAPTRLDFFGRFVGLLTPLVIAQRLLGVASGVLSGIVIAYIAQQQLPETMPDLGVYAVMVSAFVLGFIIFDGFYIYIAETVFRMFRDGSWKQDWSMGIMTIFLVVVGITIGVIDFINSTKAGEILGGKTAEKPPLQQTDNLIAQQTAQAQTLTGTTLQQATLISESVKSQISATESSTRGKIAKKEAEKSRYATLAAEGYQWAAGKIAAIDRSIADIEASKGKSIANIQSKAAKQLDKTSQSTDKALSKLTEQNAESVKVLNTYNTLRIKQFEDEYNRFSALGWLITAFLSIGPTLVTFLKVMIEVGSGIGITVDPRRRGFMAIISAKWLAFKEWFYDLIDKDGRIDVEEDDMDVEEKHNSDPATKTPPQPDETKTESRKRSLAGFTRYKDRTPQHEASQHEMPTVGFGQEKARHTESTAVYTEAEDLLNSYKVARRDLMAYKGKTDAKPETIAAGMASASKKMASIEHQINSMGFKIIATPQKIFLQSNT